jgi:hypothetical protein
VPESWLEHGPHLVHCYRFTRDFRRFSAVCGHFQMTTRYSRLPPAVHLECVIRTIRSYTVAPEPRRYALGTIHLSAELLQLIVVPGRADVLPITGACYPPLDAVALAPFFPGDLKRAANG